ncbi:MAG: MmcQ/YjbR family DNA-binding protein [Eubacterium sp.]|nr:MmcQ/YjbR family DNA-binding protein [Eubacterium sp.]
MNREEIFEYAENEFGVLPEYLWAKFPSYAVLRNNTSKKWFALIGSVELKKLGINKEGKADVMVIKEDPIMIGTLIHQKGYYPAYHMNKEHWISVCLDGSVTDEVICNMLHTAHEMAF